MVNTASPRAQEGPIREALEAGDHRQAVAQMMRLYGQPIFRFCMGFLGDQTLAEEVHQTVFIQAFRDAGRFGGQSSVKSWLYAIARHRCLDAVKIKRRRDKRFEAPGDLPDASDQAPSPEDQLAAASLAGPLARCLDKLAPQIRTAVLLRHQEGLSYAEMAETFGEKAGTLQARVARALPALRTCLKAEGARP
ncbi:MAG: RNA polymerase sigma factor [Bradymonadia bacterium]